MQLDPATFVSQAVVSALVPWVMERTKDSKSTVLTFWNQHTDLRNAVTSLLAALGGVGFAASFAGTMDAGGTLTIVVPKAGDWLPVLGMWALGFMQQEAVYRMFIKQKKL